MSAVQFCPSAPDFPDETQAGLVARRFRSLRPSCLKLCPSRSGRDRASARLRAVGPHRRGVPAVNGFRFVVLPSRSASDEFDVESRIAVDFTSRQPEPGVTGKKWNMEAGCPVRRPPRPRLARLATPGLQRRHRGSRVAPRRRCDAEDCVCCDAGTFHCLPARKMNASADGFEQLIGEIIGRPSQRRE